MNWVVLSGCGMLILSWCILVETAFAEKQEWIEALELGGGTLICIGGILLKCILF